MARLKDDSEDQDALQSSNQSVSPQHISIHDLDDGGSNHDDSSDSISHEDDSGDTTAPDDELANERRDDTEDSDHEPEAVPQIYQRPRRTTAGKRPNHLKDYHVG